MHPQVIIDHIRAATNKSHLNRRRTHDRASDIITGLSALIGVAGILFIAYYITTK